MDATATWLYRLLSADAATLIAVITGLRLHSIAG